MSDENSAHEKKMDEHREVAREMHDIPDLRVRRVEYVF